MDREKTLSRIKELHAKLRKDDNNQKKKERKKYDRKKYIAGAFMIEASGQWDDFVKSDKFDKYVTRPIDRELFGLYVKEVEVVSKDITIVNSDKKQDDNNIETDRNANNENIESDKEINDSYAIKEKQKEKGLLGKLLS